MSQPSTFRKVEESLVKRIAALNAEAYTTGQVPAEWHESKTPLTVISDSSALGHLSFNVWVQSAPNTDDASDMTFQADEVDNFAEIDARVVVAFAYKLRPGAQTEEARTATDAAVDVIRAVMAAWTAADETEFGTITFRLVDGLQPAITLDAGWQLITQDYIASFDLDLLFPG